MPRPKPRKPLLSTSQNMPRKALLLSDARLTRLMQKEPARCASVSEYSQATGLSTSRIASVLAEALDIGVLSFEPVMDEVFINTAPHGRPTPFHLPETEPNLWEMLRNHGSKVQTYYLWKLYRQLEDGGWRVEADSVRINTGLRPLAPPPALGIWVENTVAPLLLDMEVDLVAQPSGPIGTLSDAGAAIVALTTESGGLDDMVTATRRFYLSRPDVKMPVLILEAPRYQPVAITCTDLALYGRSASEITLSEML